LGTNRLYAETLADVPVLASPVLKIFKIQSRYVRPSDDFLKLGATSFSREQTQKPTITNFKIQNKIKTFHHGETEQGQE
jgi:hypothetical protein